MFILARCTGALDDGKCQPAHPRMQATRTYPAARRWWGPLEAVVLDRIGEATGAEVVRAVDLTP